MTPKTMLVSRREFVALAGAVCFNIAQRTGCKKLLWDGNRFTNDTEANSLIAMNYRPGWSLA